MMMIDDGDVMMVVIELCSEDHPWLTADSMTAGRG